MSNTGFFRRRMTELGLDILPGEHPIVPVMVGDAAKAGRMAEYLLERGVYVIGFSYPVVPMGKARIRTRVCAAHTEEQAQPRGRALSGSLAERTVAAAQAFRPMSLSLRGVAAELWGGPPGPRGSPPDPLFANEIRRIDV